MRSVSRFGGLSGEEGVCPGGRRGPRRGKIGLWGGREGEGGRGTRVEEGFVEGVGLSRWDGREGVSVCRFVQGGGLVWVCPARAVNVKRKSRRAQQARWLGRCAEPVSATLKGTVKLCIHGRDVINKNGLQFLLFSTCHEDGSVHVKSKTKVKRRAAKGGARMRTPSSLENRNGTRVRGICNSNRSETQLWDLEIRLDVRWTSATWQLRLRNTCGDVGKTPQKG